MNVGFSFWKVLLSLLRCLNGKASRCGKAQSVTLTGYPDSAGPWWSAANFWLARYSTAESPTANFPGKTQRLDRPAILVPRLFKRPRAELWSRTAVPLEQQRNKWDSACCDTGGAHAEMENVIHMYALLSWHTWLPEGKRRADERHYDSAFLAFPLLPSKFAGMVSSWVFEDSVFLFVKFFHLWINKYNLCDAVSNCFHICNRCFIFFKLLKGSMSFVYAWHKNSNSLKTNSEFHQS